MQSRLEVDILEERDAFAQLACGPRYEWEIHGVARKAESLSITNPTLPISHTPIGVNTTSLKFFKRMFTTPEPSKGTLDWQGLLAAMVDAGCSASHSGGSAVTFHDKRNKKGSIVLHKPHPDTTVDHVMLKTIGKRLTKWFAWDESTFIAVKDSGGRDAPVAETATVVKEM